MRDAIGMRFLIVGLLTLLMFIPLFFVSEIVQSRKFYSQETLRDVGREWGGDQVISGPVLVVPVQETIDQTSSEQVFDTLTGEAKFDENGNTVLKQVTRRVTVSRTPIYVYPGQFDVAVDTKTQVRHRGIFNVPVYQADMSVAFDFPVNQIASMAVNEEVILWDDTAMMVDLSNNAALRGVAVLTLDGKELPLEPIASAERRAGITAAIGDPRDATSYDLHLGLNGAQSLMIAPVGRQTSVKVTSDWTNPSFGGAFLPDGSEISEAGFSATWTIPHLARTLPQLSRENYAQTLRRDMAFGVDFIEPNDFYQKSYRAAKYAILFIALTFLTVLLIEKGTKRPAHPVQYLLIGLAQSIFVLLMVAYSEQFGFAVAYGISAGATIILLTFFGHFGLNLGKRTAVLALMLLVLYGVLYLILQSEDYALLAGATLAFVALAATMYFTRNEDWYGPEGKGLFAKKVKAPAPESIEAKAARTAAAKTAEVQT
ncbi:cell envelope integrity protein CreD [Pacificibacter marinus]|uniref:Inner membrane protein CreD n=1 Tax=Pacificibacter marinus TaxID=658057 RepID=A0A1Y5SFQ3_9RHOB|nr:cell envelope integrity protein CreD [Pacificibacter marinus]SEK49358.1 inner membrane protein [Pacificibacter marinus]SLN36925.1 Inner membrane protein CreD [Pacificibacter marinus]